MRRFNRRMYGGRGSGARKTTGPPGETVRPAGLTTCFLTILPAESAGNRAAPGACFGMRRGPGWHPAVIGTDNRPENGTQILAPVCPGATNGQRARLPALKRSPRPRLVPHFTTMKNLRLDISRRGFTLIELLVVILIFAILAAVVFAQVGNVTEDSEKAAFITSGRTFAEAAMRYHLDHGAYPDDMSPGQLPPGSPTTSTTTPGSRRRRSAAAGTPS